MPSRLKKAAGLCCAKKIGPIAVLHIEIMSLQAAQDAMDADAIPETIDMEDMSPGQLADWTGEDFVADGSGGFITVSSFPDEFPREGRSFDPSMLVIASLGIPWSSSQ